MKNYGSFKSFGFIFLITLFFLNNADVENCGNSFIFLNNADVKNCGSFKSFGFIYFLIILFF